MLPEISIKKPESYTSFHLWVCQIKDGQFEFNKAVTLSEFEAERYSADIRALLCFRVSEAFREMGKHIERESHGSPSHQTSNHPNDSGSDRGGSG